MQYHLNGYSSGDPNSFQTDSQRPEPKELPEEVDVLIIGCGPAGLTLAAQLAQFSEIKTCIIDKKPGPLKIGQADGIACRTVEMFEAFGFSEKVLKESYWVNETTFWKPKIGESIGIIRSSKIRDTEEGLSEYPHVILNQARVHDFYLEMMYNGASQVVPFYEQELLDLKIDRSKDLPVTVILKSTDTRTPASHKNVRARFVVGCDGARSSVRKSLGRELYGDSANKAWGVMDVLATTNFPDIRLKSVVHSASEGSLLIIPREGGYMTRLYIEMDNLKNNERVSARNLTSDRLIEVANLILTPYKLDVREVVWWSVYEIGQRLCDKFDDLPDESVNNPCIFIAGDACHTHSPKAGLGMNVSMGDTFNLGWKLASVLRGQCYPKLLHTYSVERHDVAKELIDFDRKFADMFSVQPKGKMDPAGSSPEEFKQYFIKKGRFTAGTEVCYNPSIITGKPIHQKLATGFQIGRRFHSAPVIRLADAKSVELGHVVKADGRWRLFIFSNLSRLNDLCEFLISDPSSPLINYTPKGLDIDSSIDVRAVLPNGHRDIDIMDVPSLLRPSKGRYGLTDYEKVFCTSLNAGLDIFDLRSIDKIKGCIVIVRPDQHVANILPVEDYGALAKFFEKFMIHQV